MSIMVSKNSEILEVQHIYPLERIASIASKLSGYIVPLLNGFKVYYETLEVKPIDITTFKRNNFGKHCQNKNRFQNVFWKRKNRFRGRELEKFIANAYVKQLPQNDEDKIRKIIISHLNKLNDKKFTIIVKEFIDHLEEQMFYETYDILNNEILNKVSTDNHYISLYSKLIKELIINKKWQKKMFNIINGNNGEYFWTLNKLKEHTHDNEYVGPFESEEEALEDAMEHHNYKVSFCSFMEEKFSWREAFQSEIKTTEKSFDLNIFAKNKYNNFLKFIYSSVDMGIFKIDLLHHVLLKLISTKELEQFVVIYEQILTSKNKFNVETHSYYEVKLNEVVNQSVISPKIRFKLQEYFKINLKNTNSFDALAVIENTDTSDEVEREENETDRDIGCIISEYAASLDYKEAKNMFDKLSNEKYMEFTTTILGEILERKESESKELLLLIKKFIDDNSDYRKYFGDFIDDEIINLYADYEVDYPKSKELFSGLIIYWLEKGLVNRNDFIDKLKNKETEDEDEKYNIELFNEKIVNLL